MPSDLPSRISALLAQEKHTADRALNEALSGLYANLSSKGTYHGSSNIYLSKTTYERDIEDRISKLLAIVERLVRSASPREVRDTRQAVEDLAISWIETHIKESQTRLDDHATRLAKDTLQHIDLGSDRITDALRAELNVVLSGTRGALVPTAEAFVDPIRLDELASLPPTQLDVSRLVRLCEELNVAFHYRSFHAVAFITRAILDHIPPVFGATSFAQVANNHSGGKSFKEIALQLETVSRKVGDTLLHGQIRKSEALPTLAQVDVRQQLDTALGEVVRILRGT
jgi:hypothetical protein